MLITTLNSGGLEKTLQKIMEKMEVIQTEDAGLGDPSSEEKCLHGL